MKWTVVALGLKLIYLSKYAPTYLQVILIID